MKQRTRDLSWPQHASKSWPQLGSSQRLQAFAQLLVAEGVRLVNRRYADVPQRQRLYAEAVTY